MGTLPVGPLHWHAESNLSWESALWLSKNVNKIVYAREAKGLGMVREAKMKHVAMPYIVMISGLQPEFSDWDGHGIDLKLEDLPDPEMKDKANVCFIAGGALALRKGGKWFAIRPVPAGLMIADSLDATPVDEAQIREMVRLPDDWETRVRVQ